MGLDFISYTNVMINKFIKRIPEELEFTEVVGDYIINSLEENKMSEKFSFLLAPRFIALVIGAIMFYLQTKGVVGEPEMILVNTILAGYITVRTIDRVSDKKVEAAEITGKVTTVSMPSDVSKVTATTN